MLFLGGNGGPLELPSECESFFSVFPPHASPWLFTTQNVLLFCGLPASVPALLHEMATAVDEVSATLSVYPDQKAQVAAAMAGESGNGSQPMEVDQRASDDTHPRVAHSGASDLAPTLLQVVSPNMPGAAGVYELEPDWFSDDCPVWVREDGSSHLYSGCGRWLIGPATVAANGFRQPIAFIFNPELHEGKWPHQVEECWQQLFDDGSGGTTWQQVSALHIAVADTAAHDARIAKKALKAKLKKMRRAGNPPPPPVPWEGGDPHIRRVYEEMTASTLRSEKLKPLQKRAQKEWPQTSDTHTDMLERIAAHERSLSSSAAEDSLDGLSSA